MKAAVLFSGGKDSTLALHLAMKEGHDIVCLLSMIPESKESYMFHHPNAEFTIVQAESMGIPIITKKTKGEKEKELKDLENLIGSVKGEVGCIVSGAIASEYQKSRIEKICKKLGLKSVTPLWHKDPEEVWKTALDEGFEIMIAAVACDGLGKDWLGKTIDRKSLSELKKLSEKHRFHLGGEGGEFETFVLDGPVFKRPLEVRKGRAEWDSKTKSGYFVIEEITN